MNDSQKSLEILIKTATELKGAEDAARRLEELIGKSKALGESTGEMEQKLASARAAIGAYKEEQAKAAGALAESAEATRELSNEEAGVVVVTREDVAAMEEQQEAAKGASDAKKNLGQAAKGLAAAFPALGVVSRLVLNPIAGMVAVIVGSFSVWKGWVDSIASALERIKLPDLGPGQVKQISAAAEAYAALSKAVRDAQESYKAVDAVHDRRLQRLREEAELEKQLLGAQKARDLAQLEALRGGMGEGQYEQRRQAIEWNYACLLYTSRCV